MPVGDLLDRALQRSNEAAEDVVDDMSEILEDFLARRAENLDQIDLIELEKNPHDKDKLAQLFRVIHTIKGICGFIGLHKLESLAQPVRVC